MNEIFNHKELSYEVVNSLHNVMMDGEYATWSDLYTSVPISNHPGFFIEVWGEELRDGKKGFSVSLCRNFRDKAPGPQKVLFTGYAPRDNAYEALLACTDKVLDHFERSLKKPLAPLHTRSAYEVYTKELMQPLLDALNSGDFELAAQLTPAKYRLCGYEEFDSEYQYEQFGIGWAGQFSTTVIPAGRYPVFAEKYQYHEADQQFMNKLSDFRGLSIFLAGKCIADSNESPSASYPYDNTVWNSPYCHAVGHSIIEGKSSIHLLPPFKAEPVHGEYNGEKFITYRIVDTSLPDRMKQNPMDLRKQNFYIYKTKDLSSEAAHLYGLFAREYRHSLFGWGGHMPLNVLSHRDDYSREGLRELLDKNIIQQRDCEGVSYELTAKERLDLFHHGEVSHQDRKGLEWDAEYKRCCKEAERKEPLSNKIVEASSRALEATAAEKATEKGSIADTMGR